MKMIEPTQKAFFTLFSDMDILHAIFFFIRSGGKCTLYCSINTTLKDIVTCRVPASFSLFPMISNVGQIHG